jgi:8-amino-7-oxononanoate synthase
LRSILVTGSDTGVGKTWVVAELARALASRGDRVQVVKVIETGVAPGQPGDAAVATVGLAGAEALTLFAYGAALAPVSAAIAEGKRIDWPEVVAAAKAVACGTRSRSEALPSASDPPRAGWVIFEGAGGIASPIDGQGRDWADFAMELAIEHIVVVIPERLGAINHARLCTAHARRAGLHPTVWLNGIEPVSAEVSASIREILGTLGIPLCHTAGQYLSGGREGNSARCTADYGQRAGASSSRPHGGLDSRLTAALLERDRLQQRRRVRVTPPAGDTTLNLSDNDYLELARHPAVIDASIAAARRYGTSASASPLITGWKQPHEELVAAVCAWHGFPYGMLWTSGYAANSAVLGTLPEKGDLILADRLIHHSMLAGLSRSGARFMRYPHLDLDRLENELGKFTASTVFVVTESVFSMDGDYPDLARLAALKRRHRFILVLDEAHALGWYGPLGAGLAAAGGMVEHVDIWVGTLGKTLASGGAYTLFHNELIRDTLINRAGEFIYSTAIPPAAAAAAAAAIQQIGALAAEQAVWQNNSREFRVRLTAAGWSTLAGDSPIVPVMLNAETDALDLAASLRTDDIWAAAVRPPTVPAGTSRLRFSLKRSFTMQAAERVLDAMDRWRRKS